MKTLAIVVAVLLAVLAVILYPQRYTLHHILTRDVYGKNTCKKPATVPKLSLLTVKECDGSQTDPSLLTEPCIVRRAVSQEKLDEFIALNGEERWVTKALTHSSELGHPLIESSSMFSKERVRCTINQLINGTGHCHDTFTGIKELNYSNHLSLENEHLDLKSFQRSDTFVGHFSYLKVSSSFHSNNFEASGALQIVGRKLWMLMTPEDYYNKLGAYSIGAYNGAYTTCVEDLEGIDIQTVLAEPGDYLRFPKAWPHQIYTFPGPNVMINFRNFVIHPWNPRDIVALAAALGRTNYQSRCEPGEMFPTSYGVGHPSPHFVHRVKLKYDMRCTDFHYTDLLNYKKHALELASDHGVDEGMWQQLVDFLNIPSETYTPDLI